MEAVSWLRGWRGKNRERRKVGGLVQVAEYAGMEAREIESGSGGMGVWGWRRRGGGEEEAG